MTDPRPLVEVRNLSLTYDIGTPRETNALNDVSLSIFPDEYVIFFGPSGCGKSTLLYCISGLLTPTSGNIIIEGDDITKFSSSAMADFHRRKMGIVFQAYNLIPTLTILDNVALPQTWRGAPSGVREAAARKQLERFSLAYASNRLPQELSGGQQQRVSIARALVNNPPLMLADEPVGNLDSVAAKSVLEIFSDLNGRDKKTIIMVTHNSAHFAFADRVIFMRDGKIIKEERNVRKERAVAAGIRQEPGGGIEPVRDFADALSDDFLQISEMYLKEKVIALIVGSVKGHVTLDELKRIFTKPIRDGGLGIDEGRAEEFVKRLEFLMLEGHLLRGRTPQELRRAPLTIEIGEFRRYLLADHQETMSFLRVKRFEEAVGNFVRGIIDEDAFTRVLALPEPLGGVGLSRGAAFHFLFKLKLITKLA